MTAAVCIVVVTVLTSFVLGTVSQQLPVSQVCLGCMCESISRCSLSATWGDSAIGPFGITPVYWNNSGKPTIGGISSDAPDAFKSCTETLFCSALTVQGYMRKYKEDCNNDGNIDCDDFVLIHHYGAYGCKGTELKGNIGIQYKQCKKFIGEENISKKN